MANLKPTDGFHLYGWMVTELRLQGFELVAYALVHQLSLASKVGLYTGGVPYLALWLQCSCNTARKYLHSLEEKGLITALRGERDGVPYCYYQVVDTHIPKIFGDTPKDLRGDTQNIAGGTPKKFGVEYNKEKNKKEFIPPTPQEVSEYARQRGFVDPEGFAHKFVEHYVLSNWHLPTGKKMQNWKQSVLSWEDNNKDKFFHRHPSAPQPVQKLRSVSLDEIASR